MKNCSKRFYEDPIVTHAIPENAIDFCLARLYADKKHDDAEEIVKRLTYEEVIGALVFAKIRIKRYKQLLKHSESVSSRAVERIIKLERRLAKKRVTP